MLKFSCPKDDVYYEYWAFAWDKRCAGAGQRELNGGEREVGKMEIRGPSNVGGPGPIQPRKVQGPREVSVPNSMASGEKVEISDAARLLGKVQGVPAMREERVREVKELIQKGKYETDDRVKRLAERVLEEISE
jgi:anti-sigma28 factor (negative regulator of flagellin synthesis)